MDEPKKIVVIGASAGGFNAITDLISGLPANLPVAIFIVMHVSRQSSPQIITTLLAKKTSYTCIAVTDEQVILAGRIYVATPDQHLVIKDNKVKCNRSAHENNWRPSIDVLFRSAAVSYGSRVIGIILSGMLYDGTSGMIAVKRSGGICIVQEPEEAQYPDMPKNVISSVEVDYRVPLKDMAYIIDELLWQPVKSTPIPADIALEAGITERMSGSIADMEKLGTRSNYGCPDCGGGLWLINNEQPRRYRCHTGHVYAEPLLLQNQAKVLEESLWVCVRLLEERRNLLLKTAPAIYNGENEQLKQADDMLEQIDRLKDLIVSISDHD